MASARFWTTAEVAENVGLPPETLRWFRHVSTPDEPRGPASFKLPGSRRVLYAVEDVEAWIAQGREQAGAVSR